MNTINTMKRTLAILLLLFVSLSFGQTTEPVKILLTVNTDELGSNRDAPGGCTLTAIPSSVVISGADNPKLFTIEVKDGTDIEVEGITQSGDEVKIKKIEWIKGINIFDSRNIFGKIKDGKEKVNAKIKRKTAPDLDYEYSIEFKVNGTRYTLDPKIKVN